jgi:hypothetical protein
MGREPCSGVEPTVADRVESLMPAEGISYGRRDCHDAQPGRLRVDFVYPEAQPRPIALEVTAIVAGEDEAGARSADDLSQRLTRIAEDERLGAWLVTVRTDSSRLRTLEPEIVKVLRDAQPIREKLLDSDGQIRPGQYTSDDLLALPNDRARGAFAAEHKRLKAMGLEELKPVRARSEHVVGVLPVTGWREIGSFAEDLQYAVDDNARKLGEAAHLEHHLAVLVDRFDASAYVELTDVPTFPPEIDVLWVVHRWKHGEEWHAVWVARPGGAEWRVYAIGGSS